MKLSAESPIESDLAPLGVLAGWGKLPLRVAEAAKDEGRPLVGLGVIDHADPKLEALCDEFLWIGIGSVGKSIRFLRKHGVKEAVMAGKIHKAQFFRPGWWWRHRPDFKCLTAFSGQLLSGTKDRKDDTVMLTLIEAFAGAGIRFEAPTRFAPELLVKNGLVAGKAPSVRQRRDLDFGWNLAKSMGGLDVGQTVCVKNQAVLAVEAIEGTDLCIQRAGDLCGHSGFTVVKVAKPGQDMRFDVPTVGTQTLESIAKAGGNLLVVESEQTILLEAQEFYRTAKRLDISVVAISDNSAKAAA
ncbi:MAG: UDP-2,3-diacylglucosamine diphosphatase LpxI [Lacipirellulaceae bacterium]